MWTFNKGHCLPSDLYKSDWKRLFQPTRKELFLPETTVVSQPVPGLDIEILIQETDA